MSLERIARSAPPARVLICLDLRERRAPGVSAPRPRPPWQDRARALLEHARRAGWPVAHLLAAHPAPEKARWRAIAGLSPTPSEPVFYLAAHEEEPSGAFLRFVSHFASAELLVMGCASGPCRLDRLARSLADRTLAAAADAMPAPPRLAGLRLAAVRGLIGAGPALRLIAGGLQEEPRP